MSIRLVGAALALGLIVVGCTRAELPTDRYSIARNPAALSACVFRDAQLATAAAEPVSRTRIEDPEEYQVTKTYHGILVWELDVSAAPDGSSLLTARHYPGLLDWGGDMMKSVSACVGDEPLRRL